MSDRGKFDDFDDYFDGPETTETEETPKQDNKPEKEEKPIRFDDEQDSDPDTLVVKPNRWLKFWIIFALVLVAVFSGWFYLRYCNPYVELAEKTGYIIDIEKSGYIFKTYEANMISEFAVNDTSKTYQRDFSFSVEDDSVAANIMNLQGSGRKITVVYRQYLGTLPWRGNSRQIVTAVKE